MDMIISIDLGTTKICAAAIDVQTLQPIEVVACSNDTNVAGLPTDHHEQCPRRIWQHVSSLIRQLTDKYSGAADIKAISISGQMHGVMLVDRNLEPVGNFITWRDHRSRGDAYAKEIANRVGCRLHPGYGGATPSWLAEHNKIPADAKALSLADYVAAKLTGVVANETTHAASWGIFDIQKNCWDADLVSKLGIPGTLLSDVKPSALPIGEIDPTRANELGLPRSTVVCSPVGDNQASVIGAAGFDKGALVINLGTGGQVSIPDEAGQFIDGFETRPMPGGGFIYVGASLCGGWSYEYLKNFCSDLIRRVAGVELSNEIVYSKLNELAAETAFHKTTLSVDTRFSGVRGDVNIKGNIAQIDTHNFNIADLAYAFLEGMVAELYSMARPMLGHISRVVASGNAVRKNPLMPAIIQKVFSLACRVSAGKEEAAVGAAAAAAMSLGLLSRESIIRCMRGK
jgi:sedoheptulokinase